MDKTNAVSYGLFRMKSYKSKFVCLFLLLLAASPAHPAPRVGDALKSIRSELKERRSNAVRSAVGNGFAAAGLTLGLAAFPFGTGIVGAYLLEHASSSPYVGCDTHRKEAGRYTPFLRPLSHAIRFLDDAEDAYLASYSSRARAKISELFNKKYKKIFLKIIDNKADKANWGDREYVYQVRSLIVQLIHDSNESGMENLVEKNPPQYQAKNILPDYMDLMIDYLKAKLAPMLIELNSRWVNEASPALPSAPPFTLYQLPPGVPAPSAPAAYPSLLGPAFDGSKDCDFEK